MASELRWILLALSAVLLIGIWWWGMRRSRQSPGNAQLRETSTGPTILGPTIMGPTPEHYAEEAESREWGVPPFEPLSIRTADFDPVQAMDLPMSATADPLDATLNMDYVEHEIAANFPPAEPEFKETADTPDPTATVHAAAARGAEAYGMDDGVTAARGNEARGADSRSAAARDGGRAASEFPAAEPTTAAPAAAAPPTAAAAPAASASTPAGPNTSETQRIVTIRVCAVGDAPWRGADLLAALENQGLRFGRYKVFHRRHSDGRTLFCAASLVEPGSFDIARMPDEEFRGLTLFAVLPGPADALETIDTLIATAVDLADALQGAVQDAKGAPLSAQRAEALREDVARFQQSLSMP